GAWRELLDQIGTATVSFLRTLVADGADVYQLFDSWAGELTADEYATWAQPFHRQIFAAVPGVPRVIFVKENPHLEAMCARGADVASLGARHALAAARAASPHLVFQGNVDENLLRSGTPEEVAEATRRCVAAGGGRRHVVNLSHGCDKATPVANFAAFVRAAKGA